MKRNTRKYIAVIPARSGSKGIQNKNIVLFNGVPLILHSLKHASQSEILNNFFLWTNSQEYFNIGSNYIDLPNIGLREDFIDDFATDEMFLNDFINRIGQFNINCDAIVLLRPTSPIRGEGLIDQCIQEFEKNWHHYDSLRTVSISNKTPYKMWFALQGPNSTKFGEPICKMIGGISEAHSMPRQILKEAYVQNGLVDIIKVDVLRRLKSSSGSRVLLYETKDKWVDIDSMSDIEK